MTLSRYFEPIGSIRAAEPTDSRLALAVNRAMRWGVSTYEPPTTYGPQEYPVRGAASVALLEAAAVQTQLYDPVLSGVPSYLTPLGRANGLIISVTDAHRLTTAGGWGGQWQSALWATVLGTAAWINWRYLAVPDRERLLAVLEYEADQRAAQSPHYLRDAAGAVLTPGDTGAEENAWNACGLVCAALMMPGHPRAGAWMDAALRLAVSSFAHPSDVDSPQIVSGRPLSEWLAGSNVELSYDVVNHGKVNPDYSQTVCLFGHAAILFGLAGKTMPRAFTWNCDRVYVRLSTYYLPGEPAQPVAYPDGPDWGARRSVSCWWPDVAARVLGWDWGCERPASYWADVHLADAVAMQARYDDGHMYAGTAEDSYPAREQIACYQLAAGHLLLWLDRHGRIRVA